MPTPSMIVLVQAVICMAGDVIQDRQSSEDTVKADKKKKCSSLTVRGTKRGCRHNNHASLSYMKLTPCHLESCGDCFHSLDMVWFWGNYIIVESNGSSFFFPPFFFSLLLLLSLARCAPHEAPPVIYLDVREGKPQGSTWQGFLSKIPRSSLIPCCHCGGI